MNKELKKAALLLKANCTSRLNCKDCPFEKPPTNRGLGAYTNLLRYKCEIAGVPVDWSVRKGDINGETE